MSDKFLMGDDDADRWVLLPGSVYYLHIGDERELRYAARPWGGLPVMQVVVVQERGRLYEEIKIRVRTLADGRRIVPEHPAEQSGFKVHAETDKAIFYRREIVLHRKAKSP